VLISAAQELFAERGYRSATTRQIADRAGVSEDLIFRYFDSKAGLLSASVVQPLLRSINGLRVEWVDNQALHILPNDELIRRFVAGLYGLLEENRIIGQALLQVLTEDSTGLLLAELRSRLLDTLEPMVAATDGFLTDRGLRRTDAALQLRLMMILVAASAIYLPATYPAAELPARKQVVDEIAALIVSGLQRPAQQ
jgi:AcrR family transcriptional regulator